MCTNRASPEKKKGRTTNYRYSEKRKSKMHKWRDTQVKHVSAVVRLRLPVLFLSLLFCYCCLHELDRPSPSLQLMDTKSTQQSLDLFLRRPTQATIHFHEGAVDSICSAVMHVDLEHVNHRWKEM